MDETLTRAAVDVSGRAFLVFEGALSGTPLVSSPLFAGVPANSGAPANTGAASFQTDTAEDFWQGFVSAAGLTLHLDVLRGRSDHHKLEALFKAAARALREACEIDERASASIPSTKGILGDAPPVVLA
jgi:imidazoleglycerol-phosphate dehydratase